MNILKPRDCTIAWHALSEIEAKVMLERRQSEIFSSGRVGDYIFQGGSIGRHIVVIVTFPADTEMEWAQLLLW